MVSKFAVKAVFILSLVICATSSAVEVQGETFGYNDVAQASLIRDDFQDLMIVRKDDHDHDHDHDDHDHDDDHDDGDHGDHGHDEKGKKPMCMKGYKLMGKKCKLMGKPKTIWAKRKPVLCRAGYKYVIPKKMCRRKPGVKGPPWTKPKPCCKGYILKPKYCLAKCKPSYMPIQGGLRCRQKKCIPPTCKKGYHIDSDGLCYEDDHDHKDR